MPKVRLSVDVSDSLLHRFEDEARSCGEPVEQLLEGAVTKLLEEMEDEERQPPDLSMVMP